MAQFCLKDSEKYYLSLSEQPKRFEPNSPVTNVFFDDTNGQVFTVRSGGVTGVTASGMDESKSTSFRMEDKGSIVSIKFSPDHKILAIQRNLENHSPTVEFVNFKDLSPTTAEYSHTCKWKNAKILGFVWPRVNEIAFITDHGIELLQVLPEKKQLKSLKNTSFSGAWFSWCAQSSIMLLAGNNGALLQPFSLNSSTVTKLQKLELDVSKPVVERDVSVLRVYDATWCAVFRHATPGPAEVWLMPISGPTGCHHMHVLKTGLVGRFAINVIDDLIVVHHQSSQTSQLFDILEQSTPENNTVYHIPVVEGTTMKPALVENELCPMYSGTWVVFQPHYIIDARLGCLWRVNFMPSGIAHSIPKEEISKVVGVLLRRSGSKQTIYDILHQLISAAKDYLVQLTKVFDEINAVYKKWADIEMARNTAGQSIEGTKSSELCVISQTDLCSHVLHAHADDDLIVQVVTAYLSSLSRHSLVSQSALSAFTVRAVITRKQIHRLHALVRRGALEASRPLACLLLSLGSSQRGAAQLALDMMARLGASEEIVEILLSWDDPISAIGAAKQAGIFHSIPARKLLSIASAHPAVFPAVFHALHTAHKANHPDTPFLKGEQCECYIEYYNKLTSES